MMPNLPFELIGRATVVVLAVVLALVLALISYIVGVAVWHRGLGYLINLCWRGYDVTGEHPPDWRREIAIFLHCLKSRDFDRYAEKRRELHKVEGRDS